MTIRAFSASLPMALLKARETAMCLFRPMLSENDLTEQQWRVLRALDGEPAPIEAGELAEKTFLLAPSLSRIMANLEERALIERSTHQSDHRRSLISISATGSERVAAIAPLSEQLYGVIEAEFGYDRLQALLRELRDLADLESSIRASAAGARGNSKAASTDVTQSRKERNQKHNSTQ